MPADDNLGRTRFYDALNRLIELVDQRRDDVTATELIARLRFLQRLLQQPDFSSIPEGQRLTQLLTTAQSSPPVSTPAILEALRAVARNAPTSGTTHTETTGPGEENTMNTSTIDRPTNATVLAEFYAALEDLARTVTSYTLDMPSHELRSRLDDLKIILRSSTFAVVPEGRLLDDVRRGTESYNRRVFDPKMMADEKAQQDRDAKNPNAINVGRHNTEPGTTRFSVTRVRTAILEVLAARVAG
jgi:hypothetical protein